MSIPVFLRLSYVIIIAIVTVIIVLIVITIVFLEMVLLQIVLFLLLPFLLSIEHTQNCLISSFIQGDIQSGNGQHQQDVLRWSSAGSTSSCAVNGEMNHREMTELDGGFHGKIREEVGRWVHCYV